MAWWAEKGRRRIMVGKENAGLETVAGGIVHRGRAVYMYITVYLPAQLGPFAAP